jgi:proteasome lid subunit RPN8/RPN11
MALKLSKAHFDELRQHGEETYPHECCGVLVGESRNAGLKAVLAVVRCGNTRTDSPRSRYNIDPRDLIRIQRESHLAGQDILGFYHSHPDHPAYWSATDLADAHWLGCSYVITSVEKGKAGLTNSFLLLGDEGDGKHFEHEPIDVEITEHSVQSADST